MLKIWTSPKYLAEWLNQSGHQEATARFVDVIETAQQLAALYDEVRENVPKHIPFDKRRLDELESHFKEQIGRAHV